MQGQPKSYRKITIPIIGMEQGRGNKRRTGSSSTENQIETTKATIRMQQTTSQTNKQKVR